MHLIFSSAEDKRPPSRDGSVTPTNPSPIHDDDGLHTPSDQLAGAAPVDPAEVSAALECLDSAIATTAEGDVPPLPGSDEELKKTVTSPEPAVISVTFMAATSVSPPPAINVGDTIPDAMSDITSPNSSPSPTAIDPQTPIADYGVATTAAVSTPAPPTTFTVTVAAGVTSAVTSTSPTTPPSISTSSPTSTPTQTPTHRSSDTQFVMMEIQELEEEPIGGMARGQPGTAEGTWPRGKPPPVTQKKKGEKDVFKFLRSQDPNFTIRRQQQHISRIFEKHQALKTQLEGLLGVSLPQDLGEAFCDGVVLCELINKLQPNLVPNIRKPTEGQPLSRVGQTQNITSFILSCKKLQVPEEKLCSAGDITEFKDPVRVMALLEYLLDMTTIS